MRRTLALLIAATLAHAAPALADPLDLSLDKLGAPRPMTGVTDADAIRSRRDFALLSTELALALSSVVLTPAATTGYSGFALDFELGFAPIGFDTGGSGPASAEEYWPTRGAHPSFLLLPSLHVRKALPFGFELGGRAIYPNQSTMLAVQGELRWAVSEGHDWFPDVSFRGAVTHLFGQRDLNLETRELDVMVGKKFGLMGMMSLTPYAAVRLTWMRASTGAIDFGAAQHPWTGPAPAPQQLLDTQASFPEMSFHDHHFLRYTLGVRMVTYALTLGLEGTYFGGADFSAGDYPAVSIKGAFYGGLSAGFEF